MDTVSSHNLIPYFGYGFSQIPPTSEDTLAYNDTRGNSLNGGRFSKDSRLHRQTEAPRENLTLYNRNKKAESVVMQMIGTVIDLYA